MKDLDVTWGSRNQSIPAPARGQTSSVCDLAPNLLEQARKRAAAENLKIEFIEGDTEEAAYDTACDIMNSMFGAMFAPRPEVVAAELLLSIPSGSMIAMGNWTPEGFVGQMFQIPARHSPRPPGMLPPSLWGSERSITNAWAEKRALK